MSERAVHRNEALRENWYSAAYEILATEGYGALKLAPLCKKLGVTTGSFYHSFDNWQDFTEALLVTWLRERTDETVAIVRENDDPVQRLRMLAQAAYDPLHRTEAAIRVWAGADDRVGQIQRKVDEGRYMVVYEAMLQLVGPDEAEAYTVWELSTLIGYEMISGEYARDHLLWSVEQVLDAAQRSARNAKRRAEKRA